MSAASMPVTSTAPIPAVTVKEPAMSRTARQRLSFYLLVLLTLYAGFAG
ncbi:MAG: hypothetical protein P3W94_002770 [Paracoccus sp. (in: a-proteobacteria)]|nr:hypothetical protein [Paracoccus sp. (in: a-proteobacteria)]